MSRLGSRLALICMLFGCSSERILEPVAQFTLAPRNTLLQQGMVLQMKPLTATDGPPLSGALSWSTSASAVASVDATGLVTALTPGTSIVTATAGASHDSTLVTVQAGEGRTLVASGDTNCGLTTSSGAVCWGENIHGQTGTLSPAEAVFVPAGVAAGVTWRSLDGSWNHTCGVDTEADIYCWGLNAAGQLGTGSISETMIPSRRVAGDRKFVSVSAGGAAWRPGSDIELFRSQQTCGLTKEGDVYCWGVQGDPVNTGEYQSSTPRAAAPGLRFAAISVGNGYVCGIAFDRRAYCWGNNDVGQLGRAGGAFDRGPRLVDGDLRFARISAGGIHACGITIDGSAWCWGANDALQVGAASSDQCSYRGVIVQCQRRPLAVGGGFTFASISAGSWGPAPSVFESPPGYTAHTCGVTVSQDIVCWGWNRYSQIRRREILTEPVNLSPAPVAIQGMKFREVSAGSRHTCAVSVGNRAYCWGATTRGQQGVPSGEVINNSYAPVAGGFLFR